VAGTKGFSKAKSAVEVARGDAVKKALEIALKSLGAQAGGPQDETPPSPAARRAMLQSGYLPAEYPMLWPRPQSVSEKKGSKAGLPTRPTVNISIPGGNSELSREHSRQLWLSISRALKAAGLQPRLVMGEGSAAKAHVRFGVNPVLLTRSEAYRQQPPQILNFRAKS